MTIPQPIFHLTVPVSNLEDASRFYVEAFAARIGRVREDWIDVWFFGTQLTLQLRPDEVDLPTEQGVRHFGVVFNDAANYLSVIERLKAAGVNWLSEPTAHESEALSGKVGGKLADPSGNVIEVKYYDDIDAFQATAEE